MGTRSRAIPASASSHGGLVYGESVDRRDHAKIFDRTGQLIARIGERKEYHLARPSPDYTRIALVWRDQATREYAIDIYDRRTQQITPLPGVRRAGRHGLRIAADSL